MTTTERVALITGGGRGIGEAIADRLAGDGFSIIVLGRNRERLEHVATRLRGRALVVDLTRGDELQHALASVERVDVLINNAGITASAPLSRMDDETFDRLMLVNVRAVMQTCRAVMPAMAKRGWGRVVNVASNAGLTGYAYTSGYCASKHAVVGLTRSLAIEFARTGVTVNAVCPGFVDTDMAQNAVDTIASSTGRSAEQARGFLESLSPQKRLMTAREVAHAVHALVSEDAKGINGQCLVVDGGQVM